MIHPDFSHCRSLQEFYDQACDQFTAKYPPIKDVIDRFVAKNEQWQYLIYDDRSFGYAVLEKNNL